MNNLAGCRCRGFKCRLAPNRLRPKLQVQNGRLVWSSVHTCPWSTRACALHCSCCTLPLTAGNANSAECGQLLPSLPLLEFGTVACAWGGVTLDWFV